MLDWVFLVFTSILVFCCGRQLVIWVQCDLFETCFYVLYDGSRLYFSLKLTKLLRTLPDTPIIGSLFPLTWEEYKLFIQGTLEIVLLTSFQWFFSWPQLVLSQCVHVCVCKPTRTHMHQYSDLWRPSLNTEFSKKIFLLQYFVLLVLVASTSMNNCLCLLHTMLGSIWVSSLSYSLETASRACNNLNQS